jgi:heme/copper-type cytochrome/quinol oxidase subunit 1
MPRLSVWFIRAALLHLALGFTLGGLLLFHKGIPLHPLLWRLLPAHIELMLFGWTAQLIMGMGFWIFPRFWRSRGNEKPAWLAFWLLNAGVTLVGLGPLLGGWTLVLPAGRLIEAAAVAAFAWHAWPRLKPPGAAMTF